MSRRHLSQDEQEAVLSLLAVRSIHKRSFDADDSEGFDDVRVCSNTSSVKAQNAYSDLSFKLDDSNSSLTRYQSQHIIGFPSSVDCITALWFY